jgi:hypothetical protein
MGFGAPHDAVETDRHGGQDSNHPQGMSDAFGSSFSHQLDEIGTVVPDVANAVSLPARFSNVPKRTTLNSGGYENKGADT